MWLSRAFAALIIALLLPQVNHTGAMIDLSQTYTGNNTYQGTMTFSGGIYDTANSGATDKAPVLSNGNLFNYYTLPQGVVGYNNVANGGPSFFAAGATNLTNGVSGSGAVALVNNTTFTGTTSAATLNISGPTTTATLTVSGTATVNKLVVNNGGGTNTVQLTAQLFAALGTCNSGAEGTFGPVTDSTTATWGATITGGSTNHVLAYCDGSAWTVAAK